MAVCALFHLSERPHGTLQGTLRELGVQTSGALPVLAARKVLEQEQSWPVRPANEARKVLGACTEGPQGSAQCALRAACLAHLAWRRLARGLPLAVDSLVDAGSSCRLQSLLVAFRGWGRLA